MQLNQVLQTIRRERSGDQLIVDDRVVSLQNFFSLGVKLIGNFMD